MFCPVTDLVTAAVLNCAISLSSSPSVRRFKTAFFSDFFPLQIKTSTIAPSDIVPSAAMLKSVVTNKSKEAFQVRNLDFKNEKKLFSGTK